VLGQLLSWGGDQLLWTRRALLRAAASTIFLAATAQAMDHSANELFEAVVIRLEAAEQELARTRVESALQYLKHVDPSNELLADDVGLLRRYLRIIAVASRDTNQIDRAIGAYEQLQVIAQQDGDSRTFAEAVIGKVVSLSNAGRIGLAESVLTAYGPQLDSIRDPRIQLEYSFWKARVLEDKSEVSAAWSITEREILPFTALHEEDGMQIARHVAASRLALTGRDRDWRAAERSLEQARDLLSSHTTLLRRGQLATGQALFLLISGDLDGARRMIRSAEQIFDVGGIISPHFEKVRRLLEEADRGSLGKS
jgi:tetratricopeptide (TPR) repeat protein